MSSGEFALIDRHFLGLGAHREDVALGIGDDAALLDPGGARKLQVSWCSAAIADEPDPGHFAEVCVDRAVQGLVEAGASPAWLTLALSMTDARGEWLNDFAAGMDRACRRHGVRLVGGDTTAGADSVTVYATGFLPAPPAT